jgi:hypothetical protein
LLLLLDNAWVLRARVAPSFGYEDTESVPLLLDNAWVCEELFKRRVAPSFGYEDTESVLLLPDKGVCGRGRVDESRLPFAENDATASGLGV